MNRRQYFTLIEMLVVMSIIFIVLGIGITGFKRLAREATIQTRAAALHETVRETVQMAKNDRVPLNIKIEKPSDPLTGINTVSSGVGSLVAYHGFESPFGTKGYLGHSMEEFGAGTNVFRSEGAIGMGAEFDAANTLSVQLNGNASHFLTFPDGLYFEARFKVDYDNQIGTTATVMNVAGCKMVLQTNTLTSGQQVLRVLGKSSTNQDIPDTESQSIILPNDNEWHKVAMSFSYKPSSIPQFSDSTNTYGNGVKVQYKNGLFQSNTDPNGYPVNNEYPNGTDINKTTLESGTYWDYLGPVQNYQADVYFDDQKIGYESELNASSGSAVTIGSNFKGKIDEVKVYSMGIGDSLAFDPKDSYIEGSDLQISPDGALNSSHSGNQAFIAVVSTLVTLTISADNNTEIECTGSARSASFPSSGGYFITGNNELVKYGSTEDQGGTFKFKDLERGMGGSIQYSAMSGEEVRLAFPVIISKSGGLSY